MSPVCWPTNPEQQCLVIRALGGELHRKKGPGPRDSWARGRGVRRPGISTCTTITSPERRQLVLQLLKEGGREGCVQGWGVRWCVCGWKELNYYIWEFSEVNFYCVSVLYRHQRVFDVSDWARIGFACCSKVFWFLKPPDPPLHSHCLQCVSRGHTHTLCSYTCSSYTLTFI